MTTRKDLLDVLSKHTALRLDNPKHRIEIANSILLMLQEKAPKDEDLDYTPSRKISEDIVRSYGNDVLTGNAPGISLQDMIEVALDEAYAISARLRSAFFQVLLNAGMSPMAAKTIVMEAFTGQSQEGTEATTQEVLALEERTPQ